MNTLFVEFHHYVPGSVGYGEPWSVNVLAIAEFLEYAPDRSKTLIRLVDEENSHLVEESYTQVKQMLSGGAV